MKKIQPQLSKWIHKDVRLNFERNQIDYGEYKRQEIWREINEWIGEGIYVIWLGENESWQFLILLFYF